MSKPHSWVGATVLELDRKLAQKAVKHGRLTVVSQMVVEVLEVYCYAGETEYLTRDGVRTFADTEGSTQMVLTQRFTEPGRASSRSDGRWTEATIESFGEQPLLTVTLTRNGVTKTIRATPNHRWFAARSNSGQAVLRIRETRDLQPGMVLASLTPRDDLRQTMPSPFGIAHGVVYGDGSRANRRGSTVRTGTYVDLWGEKNEPLLAYFNGAPTTPMKLDSGVTGIRVRNLPGYFKDRPSLDESPSYLYGWLAGYFAADGSVAADGAPSLSSARREDLVFVQAVANRLGIATYAITGYERVGIDGRLSTLYRLAFLRGNLRPEFFLIGEHRARFVANPGAHNRVRWTVVKVEDHGEREEVFCAVVPDTHTFVLADYVWTHNCAGCRKMYTPEEAQRPCRLGVQHIGGPRIQPDRDEWPEPHNPLG